MLVNGDTPRCAFRLATQRKFKNAKGEYDADFFTVVCWRGLADIVAKYLEKGARCAVVGALQNRSYQANDGTTRYITEVVADEVELLGSKTSEAAPQQEAPYAPMQGEQQRGFVQVDDDELPF
jgi:single-strand DNA-binding protein